MATFYQPKPVTKKIELDVDGHPLPGCLLMIGPVELGHIVKIKRPDLGPKANIYAESSYCWRAIVDFGDDEEVIGPFETENECFEVVSDIWRKVFLRYSDPVEVV